jgi:hypothetical protein
MPHEELQAVEQEVKKTIHTLQSTFDGCGWFTGTPSFTILNFDTDPNQENMLCEPGTEHLYALPVSSKQVVDWILDGSVKTGKVLLVKARIDLDRRFIKDVDNNRFLAWSEEQMEEIHATNAEVVVFYCNNANSNSPRDAKNYHKWLQKMHPQSKQRCVLLKSGINGVYRYLKSEGYSEEVKKLIF